PISWPNASSVANGTCSTPLAGTSVSGQMSCTVLGLTPSTSYDFQIVAYRGTLNVDATFGGLSNVATVKTPSVGPVATTVTVTPATASLVVGGTQALTASVLDQNGNAMTGQAVAWSTSNSGVATVSSAGSVTAVAAGTATITATSSGKSGTSSVTVTAA